MNRTALRETEPCSTQLQ